MREIVTAIDALTSVKARVIEVDLHKLCCEAVRRGGEYRDIVTVSAAVDWLQRTGEILPGVQVKEDET